MSSKGFLRRFIQIRQASAKSIFMQNSNHFCADEAARQLYQEFGQYLSEFSLHLEVRERLNENFAYGLHLYCGDPTRRQEFKLLAALLAVFTSGNARHIRQCPVCQRWFHARQQDQRYCKNKCRQKAWQKIPEVKTKRDNYNKEYRPQEKQSNKRALEQARKSLSTEPSSSLRRNKKSQ
jgi:cobalamin biosynthesis Mg chelatase CobN